MVTSGAMGICFIIDVTDSMREKIQPPSDRFGANNCFACGPEHPFGLRLEFFYNKDTLEVSSQLHPDELFAGFPGILHGGIQTTILDEVAFWGVWARHKKSGFTYGLDVRFRRKCPTQKRLEAIGLVGDLKRKIVPVDVRLRCPLTQDVFTQGVIRYYIPDSPV
jgi:acyl-coenzyme A thioesterase PaaI-like protein